MCRFKVNMSDDNKNMIKDIIKDIENGEMTMHEIIEKYGITAYKYNKIIKMGELKKTYVQHNSEYKKKPKNTKFKQLLQDCSTDSFDLEKFKEDCKAGIKLSELMEKYGLSLYQIRELRKKYELKTK